MVQIFDILCCKPSYRISRKSNSSLVLQTKSCKIYFLLLLLVFLGSCEIKAWHKITGRIWIYTSLFHRDFPFLPGSLCGGNSDLCNTGAVFCLMLYPLCLMLTRVMTLPLGCRGSGFEIAYIPTPNWAVKLTGSQSCCSPYFHCCVWKCNHLQYLESLSS